MSYLGIPPFGQTVRTVTTITATTSQTSFTPTGGYTVGYCDVYYNGIKLVGGTDFTASNGTTVVLTTGATSGAVVEIITYGTVTITDAVRRSGDTFAGAVAINSTLAAGNTAITGTLSASANVNFDSGTLFVDGTNNRVGINTTSPNSALVVAGTGVFTGLTQFNNAVNLKTATQNYIYFDDALAFARNGTGNRLDIAANGNIGIANSTPAQKLDVNGNVKVNSGVYSDGDLILDAVFSTMIKKSGSTNATINQFGIGLAGSNLSSGTGIAFPSSQNASSDANTFDDYEEGTWTPNVVNNGSTSSWSTKQGSYVKAGGYVAFWFTCDNGTSNSGSGSGAILLTLPFQISTNQTNMSVGSYVRNGTNYPNAIILTGGNNTTVQFWNMTSGTNQDTSQMSFVTGFIVARTF
jgi:hypothetical protein